MTTQDYTQKMNDLRKRVESHITLSDDKNSNNKRSDKGFYMKMLSVNTSSIIFYLLPPIIILILLFIIKPSFITADTINKENEIKKSIIYSKVLISVLIGGFIIDIGLWGFFKKTP